MKSMTGFGQAAWQGDGCKISVEIRSVNQRFLETRFNMPREYMQSEAELRQLVQAAVGRGKVDVNISRSGTVAGDFAVEVNTPLARAYVDAWRQVQVALGLGGEIDLHVLLARPDLVRIVERRGEPSNELPRLRQVVQQALRAFDREREREGRALARDMRQRVEQLRKLAHRMRARISAAAPETAKRLRQRVRTLLEGATVDEERVAQEVAFVLSRGDITEELVRLKTHLSALKALCSSDEPVGKRIDFLLQEIHREVNTIASKSNDLALTDLSLEARGEIEKLREQVQNVE
ncbi:MAG: YicC/YloC family endoribonuclease [Candidatus Binatia bacterium]